MACETPCNCFNDSEYEPCTENLPCCEHCPEGSPCAYAMLFKCEHKTGTLTARHITMLWKDCLFECKWSARVFLPTGFDGNSCDPTAFGNFLCFADPALPGSAYECGCDYALPTGYVDDDCSDKCLQPHIPFCDGNYLKPMQFGCGKFPGAAGEDSCGWHDWYGKTYDCDLGPDYHADGLNNCTAKVYELEILTSGYAQITVNSVESSGALPIVTQVGTYICNDWNCLPEGEGDGDHGNNFTLAGDYPNEDFPWLPKHICVVPYSSRWLHHCDEAADACACGDAGWDNICLDLANITCGPLVAGSNDPISCPRYKTGGFTSVNSLDLSSYISAPTPAPCGYFVGYVNTYCDGDPSDRMLVFVTWCDGTDWQQKTYCVRNTGSTVDSVTLTCTTTGTVSTICPDGVRFEFDCGELVSDCCEECPPPGTIDTECCPDNLLPETLTGELTNGSSCPGYDQSGSLTHSTTGSGPTIQHFWSGTISDCGTTYYVKITCDGTTWKAKVWEPDGVCMSGVASEGAANWQDATSVSCDPLELSFDPFNSAAPGCGCCTGAAPYTFTLTVTA